MLWVLLMTGRVRVRFGTIFPVSAFGGAVEVSDVEVLTRSGWRLVSRWPAGDERAAPHAQRIAARQLAGTVRFWTIGPAGSPVRLAVPMDGVSVRWSARWGHDEGWSAEGWECWIEGGALRSERWSDGTDCDGRLSSSWHGHCALDQVEARAPQLGGGHPEIRGFPAWKTDDESRRDYQAEAAGY